jgi:hypothetical protein
MITGHFQASTQYGDWKGTAAADGFAGSHELDKLFEATGDIDANEILIAFEFYADEELFFVAGYYHLKSNSTDGGWLPSLNYDFQRNPDVITVKQVKVEITRDQFFKLFKRFNVVAVRHALDITGREYRFEEE